MRCEYREFEIVDVDQVHGTAWRGAGHSAYNGEHAKYTKDVGWCKCVRTIGLNNANRIDYGYIEKGINIPLQVVRLQSATIYF